MEYCPTGNMLGDMFTKPLQGSLFRKFRNLILNLPDDVPLPITTTRSQECVETSTRSWADVVKMSDRRPSGLVNTSSMRRRGIKES